MLRFNTEECGSRRVRLKSRILCPHCRKVVIGKSHARACAALLAKTEFGCIDCGDPVRGRSWRCEPCKRDRQRDQSEACRSKPEVERARHARWRRTPKGHAKFLEARRRFTRKNPQKNAAWNRAYYLRNKEALLAKRAAYYRANKEKWKQYRKATAARRRQLDMNALKGTQKPP